MLDDLMVFQRFLAELVKIKQKNTKNQRFMKTAELDYTKSVILANRGNSPTHLSHP